MGVEIHDNDVYWGVGDGGLKQGVESFSFCLNGSRLGFCWCICCDDGGLPHVHLDVSPLDLWGTG